MSRIQFLTQGTCSLVNKGANHNCNVKFDKCRKYRGGGAGRMQMSNGPIIPWIQTFFLGMITIYPSFASLVNVLPKVHYKVSTQCAVSLLIFSQWLMGLCRMLKFRQGEILSNWGEGIILWSSCSSTSFPGSANNQRPHSIARDAPSHDRKIDLKL